MPSNLPVPFPLQPIASTSTSTFSSPKRKIFTATDLEPWFSSRAYVDLESFTLELCHAVEGKRIEECCFESEITKKIVTFLEQAEAWIDEVPLQTAPQRFGNKAFRDWLTRVEEHNKDFQKSLLPPDSASSTSSSASILAELSFNFLTSFGSGPRLDYGTGHELSFLLWLLSLRLLGVLEPRDDQAVVLRIFAAYIDLVRKLQRVFKLEPAGSKGVWGLDDHQHLVYLFGASQLIDHPSLRPSHILQPRTLVPLAPSYLLPSSILHIHTLKTGPFSEHSPLLHQIASTVPNWAKLENGLWKMYREEVLAKVPVVQHLRFGGLIRWTNREDGSELPSTGDGKEEDDGEKEEQGREESTGMMAPWIKASTSTTPTTSHAASRRTPYTVSAPGSRISSQPTSFAPPTLFPSRSSTINTSSSRRTLADEGGAAAQSSPFGVLGSATSTQSRSDETSTLRPRDPVERGAGEVVTKAPWAK